MNKRHMVMSCWGLILKSLDVSGDGWVSGCGSGYVGGIFCGEIEFQGRVLTGWWVGVGDGFLYIWVYFFAVFGWGFWCLMW